ncbi:MAG TPA: small-conductance mechanosensitive ion channel [Candidatus Limnocylindria bacterium]|nr:small-conductance mechanosensitive ion channel [Candidatus Limnocylindria bacterium]
MSVTPITDFGTAVITALSAALIAIVAALPSLIGALLLLVIGWIIAGAIAGLLVRFLRLIRIDTLAERTGVAGFLRRANIRADAAGVIAGIVKWYVRLVFIVLAANAVGLTAVSSVVNQILAFIPNLLVAIFILAAFSWLATVARDLVTGALGSTGLPNARALGAVTFAAVFAFGVVAAANQIGVAANLINILFMGVVGAFALAFGLAFGLGGREVAGQIWADWRRQAQLAMERAESTPTPARVGPGNGERRPIEERLPSH